MQHSAPQGRVLEVRTGQVYAHQQRAVQIGTAQIRPDQLGPEQVRGPPWVVLSTPAAAVQLGIAEVGADAAGGAAAGGRAVCCVCFVSL